MPAGRKDVKNKGNTKGRAISPAISPAKSPVISPDRTRPCVTLVLGTGKNHM